MAVPERPEVKVRRPRVGFLETPELELNITGENGEVVRIRARHGDGLTVTVNSFAPMDSGVNLRLYGRALVDDQRDVREESY